MRGSPSPSNRLSSGVFWWVAAVQRTAARLHLGWLAALLGNLLLLLVLVLTTPLQLGGWPPGSSEFARPRLHPREAWS